jgi:hypothetical protein
MHQQSGCCRCARTSKLVLHGRWHVDPLQGRWNQAWPCASLCCDCPSQRQHCDNALYDCRILKPGFVLRLEAVHSHAVRMPVSVHAALLSQPQVEDILHWEPVGVPRAQPDGGIGDDKVSTWGELVSWGAAV